MVGVLTTLSTYLRWNAVGCCVLSQETNWLAERVFASAIILALAVSLTGVEGDA